MSSEANIHAACRAGNLDAVRHFVSADPQLVDADDEHEWRPVFHAALMRHDDVVRYLVDEGADLSAHDGYVLHYAAEVPDNQSVVTLLVQYGALDAHVLPADDRARQFLAAIFLENVRRVRSLLRIHPILADQMDGRGDRPIHHAARNGATEIVQLLIESGASANAVGGRGHTVLYCAAGHGHLQTVQLLLQNDVDVNKSFTADGKNVAEWLAQYPNDRRFQEIRELLVEQAK